MKIQLLGHFQVEFEGQTVDGLQTPRLQILLAYILLKRDRPLNREQIAFSLWPDADETNARNNLRRLLHRLRQKLPQSDHYLEVSGQTLQWLPDADVSLDVADFESAVSTAATLPQWQEALSFYRGPLLPHFYEDWIIEEREKYQQLLISGLTRAAQLAEREGVLDLALEYVRKLAEIEVLHEEYIRWQMSLHTRNGNRAAALQVYERFVQILRDELGVPPSQLTRELHEQIVNAGDDPLPQVRPSALNRPVGLPEYQTPFVGRGRELAEGVERLRTAETRLLTLIGTGGMGKTRLAAEITRQVQDHFNGRVVFLSLAAVHSEQVLLSTLATGLGISFDGQQEPHRQLASVLQQGETLLVFDNLEHILPAGRALAADILARSPTCKLLVTSRERLNLPGEWLLTLTGLEFPEELSLEDTADRLPAFSAPQLFLQLARRHIPDYRPRPVDWLAIHEICRLTAGLPLAIELTVPWLRVFPVQEIAERLRRSLDLLTDPDRQDLSERQRSVIASLDYSWQLLSEEERRTLRLLTTFQGPFGAEAAESVAQTRTIILRQLIDRSLLQRNLAGLFVLHPLLQQYLHLAHGGSPEEQLKISNRHAAYYLDRLSATAISLRASLQLGVRPDELLRGLTAEIDNIRAAGEYLLQRSFEFAPDRLLAFSEGYALLLQYEGWFEEAIAFLERLQAAVPQLNRFKQAHLMRLQGEFYLSLGRMPDGERILKQGLTLLEEPLPERRIFFYAHLAGNLLQQAGRRLRSGSPPDHGGVQDQRAVEAALIYDQLARGYFVEGRRLESGYCGLKSLNLAEKTNDIALQARGFSQMSVVMGLAGRHRAAERYYEQARVMILRVSDAIDRAYALRILSAYDIIVARWEQAERLLDEAIGIYDRVGKQQLWGECITALNQAQVAQGNYTRSLALWAEINRVARRAGNTVQEAWSYTGRGGTLLFLGQFEKAIENLETGLELVDRLDYTPGRITSRSMLALAHWHRGDFIRAEQLARETNRLSQENPPPLITIVLAQSNITEVYLGLAEMEPAVLQGSGLSPAGAREEGRRAVAVLEKLSRAYRSGRPRTLIYTGLSDMLADQPRRAFHSWREAAALAAQFHMPYEQGRALYEIARHLPPEDRERRGLLRQARGLFSRIGAVHDVALVDRLLL